MTSLEVARREVLAFEKHWGRDWALARLGAAAYAELVRRR